MTDILAMFDGINATVTLPDGTQVVTNLREVFEMDRLTQQELVAMGARIAGPIALSLILFVVARTYRSILFVLYQLNFLLLIISSALLIANRESPVNSVLFLLTNLDLHTSNTLNVLAANQVIQLLLIWSLIATLLVQVYSAFGDLPTQSRLLVLGALSICCVPCLLIWAWMSIYQIVVAFHHTGTDQDITSYQWVYNGAWPVFAATTALCSLVVCAKLFHNARARARMGLQKFDHLQVLTVMTAQNFVVPAIFLIVVAASQDTAPPVVAGCATLVTAMFLPLGYIWAQIKMMQGISADDYSGPTYSEKLRQSLSQYTDKLRSSWKTNSTAVASADLDTKYSTPTSPTSLTSHTGHAFQGKMAAHTHGRSIDSDYA